MYFKITYSAIYNWKGSGTLTEQNNPNLQDSFCHLIIAWEAKSGIAWLLFIDQDDDAEAKMADCIGHILPGICEKFALDISNLRVFEVLPPGSDRVAHQCREMVIFASQIDISADRDDPEFWKKADLADAEVVEQLVETVGDKVIWDDLL